MSGEYSFPKISTRLGHFDRSLSPAAGLTRLDDQLITERAYQNRSAPSALLRSHSPVLAGSASFTATEQNRRHQQDLQEKVRFYQNEMEKKDRLISDLTRAESPRSGRPLDLDYRTMDALRISSEFQLGGDSARTELAALQVKVDHLQAEIREKEGRLGSKDIQLDELKLENQSHKESLARQQALVESLRQRVRQTEQQSGSFSQAQTRGEMTISALQRGGKEQQERILELEARVRALNLEREEAGQQGSSWERKYSDLTFELGKMLNTDVGTPLPEISTKLGKLVEENLLLRGRLSSLTDALNSSELESKASRETIMRLVSEINREQKNATSTVTSLETLRMERDAAVLARNQLEREKQLLLERVEASKRAWDSSQQEMYSRESRVSAMDGQLKTLQYDSRVAQTQLKTFKESLGALLADLGTGFYGPAASEEEIKDRIKMLSVSLREKNLHIESLEGKVKGLGQQLESQSNLHQAAIRRAKEAEEMTSSLRSKVMTLDGEMGSSLVLRDSLRMDKEKYMKFLERMAMVMKVDNMVLDMGFDLNGETLLARAQQLVRLEADAVADKTTLVYNLQRKLKNLKEQLTSKDLHLDLLRKKVGSLEEGLMGRSGLEREKDEALFSHRKLAKDNERMRSLLANARTTITQLKAQLLDSSNFKVRTLEQHEQIDALTAELEKLEKIKAKQSRKLAGVKQELDFTEHESNEERLRLQQSLEGTSNELHSLRQLLNETQRRERQLVDFRQVMSRMLGLDISSLAVPDYEIIARMEKLIQGHHSHSLTTHSLERSFNEGGARTVLLDSGTSPRRSRSRARSLSPSRRQRLSPVKY